MRDLWRGIWESDVAMGFSLLAVIALATALSGVLTGSFNCYVVLSGFGAIALIIAVGVIRRGGK